MNRVLNAIKTVGITTFFAVVTAFFESLLLIILLAVLSIAGVAFLGEHTYTPSEWEEGEVGYISDNMEFVKLNERYIIKDCIDNSKPDTLQRVNGLPDEYYGDYLYEIKGEMFFSGKIEKCWLYDVTCDKVIIKSTNYNVYDLKGEWISCDQYSTLRELSQRYNLKNFKEIKFW